MATATATTSALTLFSFEKALTEDYTDFYAIFDISQNAWIQDMWVRVPEGSTMEQVETAFNGGDLYTQ